MHMLSKFDRNIPIRLCYVVVMLCTAARGAALGSMSAHCKFNGSVPVGPNERSWGQKKFHPL